MRPILRDSAAAASTVHKAQRYADDNAAISSRSRGSVLVLSFANFCLSSASGGFQFPCTEAVTSYTRRIFPINLSAFLNPPPASRISAVSMAPGSIRLTNAFAVCCSWASTAASFVLCAASRLLLFELRRRK